MTRSTHRTADRSGPVRTVYAELPENRRMTAGQEPSVQPDPHVRAQPAPDRRVVPPGAPGRLNLVVDNHDRRSRAIQVQLGGPMSRYCRPRLCTIDLLPGEQREVP